MCGVCVALYVTFRHMLTIFRRHSRKCRHADKGRLYKYCTCPIAVEGPLGDKYIRESLRTRNWEVAASKAKDMERDSLYPSDKPEAPSIDNAIEQFIEDLKKHNRSTDTLDKYGLLLTKRLTRFATDKGFRFLSEVTEEQVLSRQYTCC